MTFEEKRKARSLAVKIQAARIAISAAKDEREQTVKALELGALMQDNLDFIVEVLKR